MKVESDVLMEKIKKIPEIAASDLFSVYRRPIAISFC
jgi:hypothetical protein